MVQRGIRFEREIVESSVVPGVILVKVPVGYSSSRRFAGGGSVDFLGVIGGVPVAVEAKSCRTARFSLRRISQKQFNFLKKWASCGGCSVIFLRYGMRDIRLFVIPFKVLESWIVSGLKSVGVNELRHLSFIPRVDGKWDMGRLVNIVRRLANESEGSER